MSRLHLRWGKHTNYSPEYGCQCDKCGAVCLFSRVVRTISECRCAIRGVFRRGVTVYQRLLVSII
ncbi:hypothetical protein B0H10DRAFT_2058936 [Mycena sp. CBHHK59/15]|nr:hypothetical protein B0H10DRAFT_2058936 [Mycena sp. CBHHK59/15]